MWAPWTGLSRTRDAVISFIVKILKLSLVLTVVGALALGAGFGHFLYRINKLPTDETLTKADGVVVLTGGSHRIRAGLDLVAQGLGDRLLISGVNPQTDAAALTAMNPARASIFRCCVDLEAVAEDTVGNAVESAKWAQARAYGSLIIVTSNYHMPRTRLIFADAFPTIDLQMVTVRPQEMNRRSWWTDPAFMRIIALEYIKYVRTLFRLDM